MTAKPDITVILATHNRASYLEQTLDAMQRVSTANLKVEFVVVDNHSTDGTKAVVESYLKRLPLRYIFEAQQGKNHALNRALDEIEVGDIVVFCDDDVVPEPDWLHSIASACAKYPDYSVFGGRVEPLFPSDIPIPNWALTVEPLQIFAFVKHDLGAADRDYGDMYPVGPNFWVRGEIFAEGRRYNTAIGPRAGTTFIMGSETSFLKELKEDGYAIMYCPQALVRHHVQPELLQTSNLWKRAYRRGLGEAHLYTFPQRELWESSPFRWRLNRRLAVLKFGFLALMAHLYPSRDMRATKGYDAYKWLAFNREIQKVVSRRSVQGQAPGPKATDQS